jgi:hypothetical protein
MANWLPFEPNAFPQGLKPAEFGVTSSGVAKAAPFQSKNEAARDVRDDRQK